MIWVEVTSRMIPAFATVSATIKREKNRDTLLTIENNPVLCCLSQDCSSAYGADLSSNIFISAIGGSGTIDNFPAVPLYSDFSVAVKVYGPESGSSQEVFRPPNRSPLIVHPNLDARFRRLYTIQLACKAICPPESPCLLSSG